MRLVTLIGPRLDCVFGVNESYTAKTCMLWMGMVSSNSSRDYEHHWKTVVLRYCSAHVTASKATWDVCKSFWQ